MQPLLIYLRGGSVAETNFDGKLFSTLTFYR